MAEATEQSIEATDKNVDEDEESVNGEFQNRGFDREYSCDLCSIYFTDLKLLQQHEKGEKHLEALEEQEEFDEYFINQYLGDEENIVGECEICDKKFYVLDLYHQHPQSQIHKRKSEEVRLLEMTKEDGKIHMEKVKKSHETGKNSATGEASVELLDSVEDSCRREVCEQMFNGSKLFQDHLISTSHKKVLKENNLEEKTVSCSIKDNTVEIDDYPLLCISAESFKDLVSKHIY